ncbi:MAG: DUF4345 domain-containing protein [Acidobacteriota bacterium]|nr:DUF4345 domain-containing protein [Acidobacteriota bacterium]
MQAKLSIPLIVFGLIFLGWGVYGLFDPQKWTALMGLEPLETGGLSEARAIYGGLMAGMGLFMIIGAVKAAYRHAVWLFLALSMGGLVLGRLISLAFDGAPQTVHWIALAMEAAFALWGFIAFRSGGKAV